MEKVTLNVDGMSCEHCVNSITTALSKLSAVSGTSVDLKLKTVAVEYNPTKTTLDEIKNTIEEQGFDVLN